MQQATYRVMPSHALQAVIQVDQVPEEVDTAMPMRTMMQLDLSLSKSNEADSELGSSDLRELYWSLSLLVRGTLSIVSHPVIAFSFSVPLLYYST